MPGNAGRKPDPTVIRILKGNPSKRPINKDEPKPKKGSVSVPKHLDKKAKANFRRIKKIVDDMGILTVADRDLVKRYAYLDARFDELAEFFQSADSIYYEAITKEGSDRPRRSEARVSLVENSLLYRSCINFRSISDRPPRRFSSLRGYWGFE